MRIIITDDDPIVVSSLKTILTAEGVTVAATGSDGDEAVKLYAQFKPDVMLMDIRMKRVSGLDAAKSILKDFPRAKILFLTTFSDDEYIISALKMGAKGYILKQDFESILPAVNAVNGGHRVFGDDVVTKIPIMDSKADFKAWDLDEKEFDIIKLIANGLSNREISEKIYLSEGTVRNYISAILDKLQLRDRTQLAIFYYKNL